MERKCSFRFGTPKPISFRETLGLSDSYVDLEARVAGTVEVTEYDEARYGSCAALEDVMRRSLPDLAEKALGKAKNSSVMGVGQPGKLLADILRDDLRTMGIISEIDIFSFALTEDSDKRLREYEDKVRRRLLTEMAPDRIDRPSLDYIFPVTDPEKMISDCVPPMLFDPADIKKPGCDAPLIWSYAGKEVFRCVCGYEGDVSKFCPNCGRAVRA